MLLCNNGQYKTRLSRRSSTSPTSSTECVHPLSTNTMSYCDPIPSRGARPYYLRTKSSPKPSDLTKIAVVLAFYLVLFICICVFNWIWGLSVWGTLCGNFVTKLKWPEKRKIVAVERTSCEQMESQFFKLPGGEYLRVLLIHNNLSGMCLATFSANLPR